MDAQTAQPPSGSSSAAYPRWVMLDQYCHTIYGGNSSCSLAAYEAKTLAAARTSAGHMIHFSLHLEEPRAISRVRIQAPDGADVVDYRFVVVAAHGNSLLIRVAEENDDYFVYNAGDAAAEPPRPPSLSLLPPCCHVFYPTEEVEEEPVPRLLYAGATGLLRRGKDELVVAELSTVTAKVAALCLFRSGEWSVMRLPISLCDTEWPWDTVGPLGDQQLCWVEFWHDVLVICDVFEDSPWLQCVGLPKDPCLGVASSLNRKVCTTAGGSAIKYVNIFPRCCCGDAGATNCKHSRHAYTIHTWMLRMDDDGGMEWVKDGIVDASELWALDAYKGLPRVPLDHPVLTMDDHESHVIYFQVCEKHHVEPDGDDTIWLLKVDTKSKTIQSVSHHEVLHTLIPSNVLHFFNSYTASDGALTGQRLMGTEKQPMVVIDDDEQLVRDDDASNSTLQPSLSFAELSSEGASEFLEAFLEISRYGFGGDELKAYKILSHDNGRLFKSLLRLPKNLRKDWLLMEIKASQAY